MFDDFSCVMIDGALRKPFLLYGRYGSLSGYIVLAARKLEDNGNISESIQREFRSQK